MTPSWHRHLGARMSGGLHLASSRRGRAHVPGSFNLLLNPRQRVIVALSVEDALPSGVRPAASRRRPPGVDLGSTELSAAYLRQLIFQGSVMGLEFFDVKMAPRKHVLVGLALALSGTSSVHAAVALWGQCGVRPYFGLILRYLMLMLH